MNDKDNDISLMRSKKMKANSKTIRRMKVNVRSEESKSKHSTFETTFQNWKENGEDVALLMPEFSAKWLPIAEESGSWSGWVLLREIFPLISAELAGMALMPETERLIGNGSVYPVPR